MLDAGHSARVRWPRFVSMPVSARKAVAYSTIDAMPFSESALPEATRMVCGRVV